MSDAARRFTAFEAAGWSARARSYADLSERVTARVADALLDAGGVAAGTRVLDVGCGPGVVVAAALARGARPTGVDVAAGMLEEARRRHAGVELVQADVVDLPFAGGAFDAAVGNFVLNHLPEPERAVAELARVLAPRGRVALSLWAPPERTRWLGLVTEALAEVGVPMPAVVDEGPPSDRFADAAAMRGLLEGAGLRDASVATVAFEVTVPNAGALWDGVLGGSVRTSAAILARPPEEQGRARAALARLAEAYRGPGGLVLPVEVVIGSARRAERDGGAPGPRGRESMSRERRPAMAEETTAGGFTAEERAAMKERAAELRAEGKKGAKRADGLQAVLDAIAKMAPEDRALAERVHVTVTTHAPELAPKTWYGMPAYAGADGKAVVFFQDAGKFKARYATLGFQDTANLDDGDIWPTSYALRTWNAAVEEKVAALVRAAVS